MPKKLLPNSHAPHVGEFFFPNKNVDMDIPPVRLMRYELRMSRKTFAYIFGFTVSAVAAWEQERRKPDLATRYYLYLIFTYPHIVMNILRGKSPGRK